MIVDSLSEWKALCKLFMHEEYVAVDFETYPVFPKHGQSKALVKKGALVKDRARIYVISIACSFGSFAIGTDKLTPDYKHLPASEVLRAFRPVLESEDVLKAFHNASYDVTVAKYAGIEVKNYVCTMLMGAVKDTNLLKGLKTRSLQVGMYMHQMSTLKNIDEFMTYADEDALACLRLYEAYQFGELSDREEHVKEKDIQEMKLEKWQRFFVYRQEMPVLSVMIEAEHRGIKIDVDYFKELEVYTKKRKEEVLTTIYSHSDRVFNVDSPQQLNWFLYDHLGLKPAFLTPTGAPSADKKALFYMKNAHPAVDALLEYRGIKTLLNNYINTDSGIVAYTDEGFIVHCSINTHQAITGRFSVTSPALQTIPREGTVERILGKGWSIRKGFIARPGYKLLALDYSQIEIRLIATYSKEKAMIEVLCDGGDIHQLTADLCGVPRQIAKNLNFGLCLVPGTLIVTDQGELPIEEVAVGMKVLTHKGRWKKVTEKQKLRARDTVRITTASGKAVRCTLEHQWRITLPNLNGQGGKDVWCEATDLEIGDYMVPNRVAYGFSSENYFSSENAALFIGWFLSEGCLTPTGSIRIKQSPSRNPDVYQRMTKILTEDFESGLLDDNGCTLFSVPALFSKGIANDIYEIDFKLKSGTKSFSELIPKLSVSDARWLLAGLWDGDGSITLQKKNGRERLTIAYYSKSVQLLYDIQNTLKQFGINSKVYDPPKGRDVGTLHVVGSFSKDLFIHSIPTVKCERVNYSPKKRFNTEERIKMIEKIPYSGFVYDITVEDDHSFIANGLVSHNCYGMGPWKLADMLTMEGNPTTESQAKEYHQAYHAAYPGIKRLHDALVAEHNTRGYITCLTGRRRHIPELMSNVKKQVSAGRRIAANNTIQISAGDLLKQSIVRIKDDPRTKKQDIHFLLQIHDELLFEVPEDTVDECKAYLAAHMETLPDRLQRPVTVPIKAEGNYGDNWAEAK